jgi:gliding motility-associated-like protein
MKKVLLFSTLFTICMASLQAQVCTATSFDVDLSASIDSTVTFQSTRNGNCCTGTNCIRFNLTLNPACSYINFNVQNPAPPGNAAYYQIDCGPQTSLGTPICIVGKTNVVITFCKPGNDNPIYTITAAGALKGSDDITVREGCTGSMNVSGLQTATINWTSIYPGTEGAYNAWLNCTSGCTSVNVTPQTGAPAWVDYKVSGYRLCGPLVSDTIRVYTTPQIALSLTPANPSVCAGGSSSVTLTATASGGDEPYNFLWSNGQTGTSITVNTGNTYSVAVTDARNCLPATASVLVSTTPLPQPPTLTSNGPVCEGTTLQLFASSVAGATYSWTGPNGFASSLQNPVINNIAAANAGTYAVTVTVGQCTSISASISVSVKPVPLAPTLGTNAPVCEGANLILTASNTPGATYNWTGPNGFTSSAQNPSITAAGPLNSGDYSVTATVNGCSSLPSSVLATVNPLPPAPVINANSPVCQGNTIMLSASGISGATYTWTGPNGFASSVQNPVMNNAALSASGTYSVKATVNSCTGPSSSFALLVNPIPAVPILSSNSPVCEGADLALAASSIPAAAYAWTGPNGFTSALQSPVLDKVSINAAGTYSVFVTVNGCSSPAASLQATVNQVPAAPLISGNTTICEGTILNLSASPVAGASYNWQGPNNFSSNTRSLSVTNASPLQSGQYAVSVEVNGCTSPPALTTVTVNSLPIVPAITSNSPVCSGNTLSLFAPAFPGTVYSWTGPNGFTSSSQNPAIANASLQNAGNYQLSVSLNGCWSASASTTGILVKQTPSAPSLTSNSPLCEGSTLNLAASAVPGGTCNWIGPNGFTSSTQNPVISNISSTHTGNYTATVTLNGCSSASATTSVLIDRPVFVNAGSDQLVCLNTAGVNLAATSGNGAGLWTSAGTGSFSSTNNPVAVYDPSDRDKNAAAVTLYFASVNNGACPVSTSATTIRFAPLPTAATGPDQIVCANNANVLLNAHYTNASGGVWTTSGTGSFQPSASDPTATYIPGTRDKTEGSVQLSWTTTGNGPCLAASAKQLIAIKQPPSITGNNTWYAFENNGVVLKPLVSGSHLTYSWTPAVFLNSDTVPDPLCTPNSNISYKLAVENEFGCSTMADINVKLVRNPVIPNVFTPNGDGINDTWQVKNLPEYTASVVDIYNRYGQLVYHSTGYAHDWDGKSNGKPLPAGTYYYIIDLKADLKTAVKPLSGFVDIVR